MSGACERTVTFQIDEIEELAALVTMYCDLDPNAEIALVLAKQKLLAALVDVNEEPDAAMH